MPAETFRHFDHFGYCKGEPLPCAICGGRHTEHWSSQLIRPRARVVFKSYRVYRPDHIDTGGYTYQERCLCELCFKKLYNALHHNHPDWQFNLTPPAFQPAIWLSQYLAQQKKES